MISVCVESIEIIPLLPWVRLLPDLLTIIPQHLLVMKKEILHIADVCVWLEIMAHEIATS